MSAQLSPATAAAPQQRLQAREGARANEQQQLLQLQLLLVTMSASCSLCQHQRVRQKQIVGNRV
jgi:hypothetical protein